METLPILILIIIASLVQIVISIKKRRQERVRAEVMNTNEGEKSYQHFPYIVEDNPYDFGTPGRDSMESGLNRNAKETLVQRRDRRISEPMDTFQLDMMPSQCEDRSSPPTESLNNVLEGFDPRKAIIYSEIMKPKF